MDMAGDGKAGVPQSPETQPSDVRVELDQDQVTHEGSVRDGDDPAPSPSSHVGAVEDETTSVMPPVRGPADLVSETSEDDLIDPADELTPG